MTDYDALIAKAEQIVANCHAIVRAVDDATAASVHDEIVRAERDRIRRELRKLREKALRIRDIDPEPEYLTGYTDALGDLIGDLSPQA